MLVKFLSFTASVIGTARYKAIFLSCLVLVFSIASVTGMALWHSSGSQRAASTLEKAGTEDDSQQGSPQLGNSRKQAIQNEGSIEAQTQQQPSGTTQNPPAPKPAASTGSTPETVEITLGGKTEWSLAPGKTTDPILATVPSDKSVEWTLVIDASSGLSIVHQEQSATILQFQIHRSTEQNTTQAESYQVIIQAKDTTQKSVVPPKTITIKIL
jgi:hypothetical protein